MIIHITCEVNPETRGTLPIQFFDVKGDDPPAGTKATPRPVDRPRELPPPWLSSGGAHGEGQASS
jgi:hypothetical protein